MVRIERNSLPPSSLRLIPLSVHPPAKLPSRLFMDIFPGSYHRQSTMIQLSRRWISWKPACFIILRPKTRLLLPKRSNRNEQTAIESILRPLQDGSMSATMSFGSPMSPRRRTKLTELKAKVQDSRQTTYIKTRQTRHIMATMAIYNPHKTNYRKIQTNSSCNGHNYIQFIC